MSVCLCVCVRYEELWGVVFMEDGKIKEVVGEGLSGDHC